LKGELYSGKIRYGTSNNQKTRVNTSLPKRSRKNSDHSEIYKPSEVFQQISSKELSELSKFPYKKNLIYFKKNQKAQMSLVIT
jgi:hypothetical protein